VHLLRVGIPFAGAGTVDCVTTSHLGRLREERVAAMGANTFDSGAWVISDASAPFGAEPCLVRFPRDGEETLAALLADAGNAITVRHRSTSFGVTPRAVSAAPGHSDVRLLL
jgi:hypothetical protein